MSIISTIIVVIPHNKKDDPYPYVRPFINLVKIYNIRGKTPFVYFGYRNSLMRIQSRWDQFFLSVSHRLLDKCQQDLFQAQVLQTLWQTRLICKHQEVVNFSGNPNAKVQYKRCKFWPWLLSTHPRHPKPPIVLEYSEGYGHGWCLERFRKPLQIHLIPWELPL